MKMKRALSLLLAIVMVFALAACGSNDTTTTPAPATSGGDVNPPADDAELTATQQIIKEAEGMTMEELAAKAIEESNGKTFYGVGNSSRGATALPLFIEYLQSIDPSYNMTYEWQQPKNNNIFSQLTSDSLKDTGTFSMTLIQDGNQIESKMVQTGILDTFIPLDWATANGTTPEEYEGYLPLQTLNKVFMYNNTGDKTFDNVWDFVGEGEHGLFMDIDSELVGKNFLYMLTEDTYAGWLKDAFDALSADEQAYFQPTIDEMESEAADLGLGENGKYALACDKALGRQLQRPDRRRPDMQHPRRRLRHRPVRTACLLQAPQRWRAPPSPRTTSPSPRTTTTMSASAASATATTCSSPRTARCPGLPARSSPT